MNSPRTRIEFAAPERETRALGGALEAAASAVLRSGRFILGESVEAFEAAFGRAIGAAHVVGMSSGSDALVAALAALGVGVGDVVVVADYSFVATVEAIARVGATPRFCDVTAAEALIDATSAVRLCDGARAILAVDLYGRIPDVAALRALGVPIVEDAAQSVGAAGALLYGDIACTSFYPSKPLGAAGDGGACATASPEHAARLRELRQHGRVAPHDYARVGGNFRLDALQASVLAAKLPNLEARTRRRLEIVSAIDEALGAATTTRPTLPFAVTRVTDRPRARALLEKAQIASDVHYPYTLSGLAPYAPHAGATPTPNAARWAREALCIPAHPELDDGEVERVVAAARALRSLCSLR